MIFFLQKKLSLSIYDFGIFWRMISLSSIEAAGKSQAGKKKQTKTWNFHMANLGFWTGGVAPKRLQWFEHLGSRNLRHTVAIKRGRSTNGGLFSGIFGGVIFPQVIELYLFGGANGNQPMLRCMVVSNGNFWWNDGWWLNFGWSVSQQV